MNLIKTGNIGNFLMVAGPLVLTACFIHFFRDRTSFLDITGRQGLVVFTCTKIRSLKRTTTTPGLVWWKGIARWYLIIGHLLRQTRIHELAQICNIIKGDMSWEGPRPEELDFVKEYTQKYPAYDARHAVRPWITGLTQIHNPNATIDDHQVKLVHDMEYLSKASLWMDLSIPWQSVGVVVMD